VILRLPEALRQRNSIAIGPLADKMTGDLGLQRGNSRVSRRQGAPLWFSKMNKQFREALAAGQEAVALLAKK
jgi:hypothetical protein